MENILTNDEFNAWLQGYVVLSQDEPLTEERIRIIKNHACLVNEIEGFLTPNNQVILNSLAIGRGLSDLISI